MCNVIEMFDTQFSKVGFLFMRVQLATQIDDSPDFLRFHMSCYIYISHQTYVYSGRLVGCCGESLPRASLPNGTHLLLQAQPALLPFISDVVHC